MVDDETVRFAVSFAHRIANRDYDAAFSFFTPELAEDYPLSELKEDADAMLDDMGDVGAIEAGENMDDWPGREEGDTGWVYVSIGGPDWSEAVTVVVSRRGNELKLRELELGRP